MFGAEGVKLPSLSTVGRTVTYPLRSAVHLSRLGTRIFDLAKDVANGHKGPTKKNHFEVPGSQERATSEQILANLFGDLRATTVEDIQASTGPLGDNHGELTYISPMSNDPNTLPASIHHSPAAVDALVLGTVNAPYKRAISAEELAQALATGKLQKWIVHVATFFTDVRPALVTDFADVHGIRHEKLEDVYSTVKQKTGERNAELEAALVALAHAA